MRNTGQGRQRNRERYTTNKELEHSLHDWILLPTIQGTFCVLEHTDQYSSAVLHCHEQGCRLHNISLYAYSHVLNYLSLRSGRASERWRVITEGDAESVAPARGSDLPARKGQYPDEGPARGRPYDGIENLRPETEAAVEAFLIKLNAAMQ